MSEIHISMSISINNRVYSAFSEWYQRKLNLLLTHLTAEIRSGLEPEVPRVIECLSDPDWHVRRDALDAIGILSKYGG